MLAIFNLVPAFPLDGGCVLRAYLWHRSGDILSATKTASQIATFFAYALIFLGMLSLFQDGLITGLWQIVVGLFLLVTARGSYQDQRMRSMFDGKTAEVLMNENPVTVSPDISLSELADTIMLNQNVSFVPVLDGLVLLGHIDSQVLSRIDRENWANTCVGDIFVTLEPHATILPNLSVQDLMALITQTGQRKFMVVKDHRLLGVISLADLTQYLHTFDISKRR